MPVAPPASPAKRYALPPRLYAAEAMPADPALLCYDGSEPAKRAIRSAGELLHGGPALVLTVWEPYRPHLLAPVSGTIAVASGLAKEYDDASVEVATKTAEEGVELAAAAGFDAQPLVAHGRPKDAIVEAAEEHQARAVVLGSHGQG